MTGVSGLCSLQLSWPVSETKPWAGLGHRNNPGGSDFYTWAHRVWSSNFYLAEPPVTIFPWSHSVMACLVLVCARWPFIQYILECKRISPLLLAWFDCFRGQIGQPGENVLGMKTDSESSFLETYWRSYFWLLISITHLSFYIRIESSLWKRNMLVPRSRER